MSPGQRGRSLLAGCSSLVVACQPAGPPIEVTASGVPTDAASAEDTAAPPALSLSVARPAAPSSSVPFLRFEPPLDGEPDAFEAYLLAVFQARQAREKQLTARWLQPGRPMMEALKADPYVRQTFAESLQNHLEAPDEVRLHAVCWNEEHIALDAILEGTPRPDIYGSVPIPLTDVPTILGYLYWATALPDTFGASCDNPHHALMVRRGDVRVGLAICFDCNRLNITWDRVPNSPDQRPKSELFPEPQSRFTVELDPRLQRLLDARLRAGGVPLDRHTQ